MAKFFDLVIRNGTIVDGMGGEPFVCDIAVVGGRIAALGQRLERGREEIDARDHLVVPGFVDIHTHYDGQVTWESRLSPSSNHGVTTVVTGNCGVGFAPCHPDDREELIALMAGVEDIPEVVMTEGIPWNWTSFPEYLQAVDSRPHDADIAAMVPHSALRVHVMRRRAVDREPATEADCERMAQLMRDAMRAGALGFGTSRAIHQKSIRGQPIPTVGAAEVELKAILAAMSDTGSGVFQALSDFEQFNNVDAEFAMFRRLVRDTGRPMSFTLNQKHSDPDGWRRLLALTEAASDAGLPIKAQVLGRPTGVLMGHELTFNPFATCPSYREICHFAFDRRVVELRNPDVRSRILSEGRKIEQASPGHPFWDWTRIFEMGPVPDYEPPREESIAERAKLRGCDSAEFAYDTMLKDEGRRLLLMAAQNYGNYSLEPSLEMMRHKDTVLGLGDGGAHYGIVCDASYPTSMLAYWSRDRKRGARLSLPVVVKKLTSDPAAVVGLCDRGRIASGYRADLNIIDYDRLQLRAPEVVYDLPTGGRRIIQRADGYSATIMNGHPTYRDGVQTGILPGRVVRGPQPAPPIT